MLRKLYYWNFSLPQCVSNKHTHTKVYTCSHYTHMIEGAKHACLCIHTHTPYLCQFLHHFQTCNVSSFWPSRHSHFHLLLTLLSLVFVKQLSSVFVKIFMMSVQSQCPTWWTHFPNPKCFPVAFDTPKLGSKWHIRSTNESKYEHFSQIFLL